MIQQVERSYGSSVCSLLALHAGLEKVLYRSVVLTWLFSPLKNKNTLSWVDRKAGHTGGFRYPCSDPHVRPCSHTYTHGVPLYLPVLTLQKSFIKTQLIHSRVSSLFSSSMLCCWEVRCRGEAGLGQHAAGGVVEGSGRAGCWCGAMSGGGIGWGRPCFLGFFILDLNFSQLPTPALPLTAVVLTANWKPLDGNTLALQDAHSSHYISEMKGEFLENLLTTRTEWGNQM